MATNQEFFCRRQLRSMTSCSLPIKLLNCWSLSKDNLPEGKSQDVTMTYNQILHKTEHGINNSIKIEGRYCNEKVKLCAGLWIRWSHSQKPCSGLLVCTKNHDLWEGLTPDRKSVIHRDFSSLCACWQLNPTNLIGWEYQMISLYMLKLLELPRGCDSWYGWEWSGPSLFLARGMLLLTHGQDSI